MTKPARRGFIGAALDYVPAFMFAALLAPTRLNTLRGTLLPSWLSPYHILALGVLVLCIWSAMKAKPFALPPLMLWAPLVGLGLVMSVGLSWSEAREYGAEKLMDYWALSFVAGVAPWYLLRDEDSVRRFIHALIVLGTALAGVLFLMSPPWKDWASFNIQVGSNYLLIQQMGGLAVLALLFVMLREDSEVRLGALAMGLTAVFVVMPCAIAAGGLAVIIAPLIFLLAVAYWWLLRGSLMGRRAAFAVMLVIILVAVLHAGGKGPVLSLLITTAGLAMMLASGEGRLAKGTMRLRFALYPAAILGVIGLMLLFFGYSRFVVRFVAYFDVTNPASVTMIERLLNIKAAWAMITQHPVLGGGIGGFSAHAVAIPGMAPMKYPHNIILEALAETGALGTALLLALLLSALWMLYRMSRANGPLPLAVLGFLLFVFLCAQTSQDINNVALFGLIGLAHSMRRFHPLK